MNEETTKKEKLVTSGWRFWIMIVFAGLIGRLFGILGAAIILAIWWGCEWLIGRNRRK